MATKIASKDIKKGTRFGSLVVVRLEKTCECHLTKWWRVKCDCGTVFVTRERNLRYEKTVTCRTTSGSCPFFASVKKRDKIRIEGDVAFIPLTRGKWAKIDVADLDKVGKLLWDCSGGGYAARHVGRNTIFLHNVLL